MSPFAPLKERGKYALSGVARGILPLQRRTGSVSAHCHQWGGPTLTDSGGPVMSQTVYESHTSS